MNLRKLILGVAVSVLPLAALTAAGGSGIAGASSVGTGTLNCDIGGTVTFSKPLNTYVLQKRVDAKITINPGSGCTLGSVPVTISRGSGRFVLNGTSNTPCFRYGGGWGASLTLTLHYAHLKSSVYKGGIQGVQAGGEASSLNGEGNVTGSYPSTVSGPYPSGASFNGLMNDAACFGTGLTSTSYSIYMTNF
jgi:hypothetical protein